MNKKWQAPAVNISGLQRRVTREGATEPPFANPWWNNRRPGLYVDLYTGDPLFSSLDKFDSSCGWPSFSRPVDAKKLGEVKDTSHGMIRTEVRSSVSDSHLGHVFDDGPGPEGLRYCINSAAVHFIPLEELERAGYSDYASLFAHLERAVLAGGCFWGTEAYFRRVTGVVSVRSGYTGGEVEHPTYEQVCSGATGHAEAVEVWFDRTLLSFRDVLRHFFRIHNPTTEDRQGADIGTQYRSAVFYTTEEQNKIAHDLVRELDSSGRWRDPVITAVDPAGAFYQAEDYHQEYLEKHPGGYCHVNLTLASKPLE